jgi:hypothetical protein
MTGLGEVETTGARGAMAGGGGTAIAGRAGGGRAAVGGGTGVGDGGEDFLKKSMVVVSAGGELTEKQVSPQFFENSRPQYDLHKEVTGHRVAGAHCRIDPCMETVILAD